MTVGEALAEARYRAGLSVDEVSDRTKIRETVIRCIEQDDYGACGGDLYVRGYVRAIAGAVGIDAQPLIREYDLGRADAPAATPHASAPPSTAATSAAAGTSGTAATSGDAGTAATSGDAGTAATSGDADTAADARAADSALPITRPQPILDPSATPDPAPSAATADTAIGPAAPPGGPACTRGRRRAAAIFTVLALAAAGTAGGLIVSGLHHARGRNTMASAVAAAQRARHGGAAQQGSGTRGAPKSAATAAKAGPQTTPKPAPRPGVQPARAAKTRVRALPIALAEAFGPDGVADGDNPQGALLAITPGAPLPWRSQWYATAHFGLLKSGTGLLIDMGRKVTITSVRIVLAPYRGADLQLRVGDAAVPGRLKAAARAVDAGGTVRLRLRSPVRARYLLIWFTLLPPNGTGQYQASVYRVVVNGRY